MKWRTSYSFDMLFAVALFCLFTVTALLLASFGSGVYRRTRDTLDAEQRLRTAVTYIAGKLRSDETAAVALESELETRELMAQVMALPPPDGELFLRRYVYGETAAQLGVHFNMPAATVRTRLHRARLALQKLLKEG